MMRKKKKMHTRLLINLNKEEFYTWTEVLVFFFFTYYDTVNGCTVTTLQMQVK